MMVLEMWVLFSLALSAPSADQGSVREERGAEETDDEAEEPAEVDPWTFSEDSLDEIDVPPDARPAPDDSVPAEAVPSPEDTPLDDTPLDDTPLDDTPLDDTPLDDTPPDDTALDDPVPADDGSDLEGSALTGGTAQATSWVDSLSDDDPDPFAHLEDERVGSWESADAKELALSESKTSPASESTIYERGGAFGSGLILGAKGGGGRAQAASNGLGWSLVGELELGYIPPLPEPIGRNFQLFVSGGYAAPSVESAVANDARLGGASDWRYRLTLHQAIATLGGLYRLPTPLPWLRPYASAGARGYWSWTVVDGSVGSQPFLQTTEARVDLGGYGGVGADLMVGPGAFLAELQLGLAFLDGRVLRASQGTVNLVLGYRLML